MHIVKLQHIGKKLPISKDFKAHTNCTSEKYMKRLQINHTIFDINGHKESLDSLLKGDNSATWWKGLTNEFGCLAQGINGIEGNDCIAFILYSEVLKSKKVTYATMVCDYRPLKQEKYRVCLTIGGDKLEYNHNPTSPAASLVKTKMLLNSVISILLAALVFLP